MAAITFTCFAKLPPELRLMIWEEAVRPLTDGHAGIHSFTIFPANQKEKGKDPEQFKLIQPSKARNGLRVYMDTNERENRSAYLWDAGLFTACRESRMVIMGRRGFQLNYWREKAPCIAQNFDKYLTSSEGPEWHQLETTMTVPSSRPGGENWQLVTRPYTDGFKMDVSAIQEQDDWRGIMSRRVFRDLKFPESWSARCGPVKNMIFEWDASWNENLPRDITDLVEEWSPRGFVTNLMFENTLEAPNESFRFMVWLVDRTGAPQRVAPGRCRGTGKEVFYDMDEELVELDPDHGRHDYKTSAWFIYQVEELGMGMFTMFGTEGTDLWFASKFMGILGPK